MVPDERDEVAARRARLAAEAHLAGSQSVAQFSLAPGCPLGDAGFTLGSRRSPKNSTRGAHQQPQHAELVVAAPDEVAALHDARVAAGPALLACRDVSASQHTDRVP